MVPTLMQKKRQTKMTGKLEKVMQQKGTGRLWRYSGKGLGMNLGTDHFVGLSSSWASFYLRRPR